MAALPPIDYQQLAQTLLTNVAAGDGAAGAAAGGGAAPCHCYCTLQWRPHGHRTHRVVNAKVPFRELCRHKRYGVAKQSDFPRSCI